MDTLRKQLGEHVRRTREEHGYRSQPALADAANISARSVASVERGEQVGRKVITAIERALRWPAGSIAIYLDGGELPRSTPRAVRRERTRDAVPYEWSADARRKIIAMSSDEIIDFGRTISDERVRLRWLREALRIKEEAAAIAVDIEAEAP